MSTEQQLAPNPTDDAQVRTAFLLGWAVSQTLGHLRKGARPSPKATSRPADYAPRLVVSDGVAEKSTDAFVLAAQRIVQFYRALGFEATDQVSPLTQAVNRLPEDLSAWLDGESTQFYSPHELRELLNAWSLQVWARLDGASVDGLRAFTAGMSLADTFWYLRLATRRPISNFFVGVLTVLVPALLRLLPNQPVSVSDLVAVGNLLWTVLVGLNLPLLMRLAYQPARAAQRWLDDQLTIYFIARRTYVPWNQYVKQ